MARVLVVDDSSTIRRVVSAILERRGYETETAADGQLALDAVEKADPPFDLVLLDFVMPKMNGYQFCRAVREKESLRPPPVVLMSAKSERIRDQFVQQTGALDAIAKPFDATALALVVENALRRIERGAASAARIPDFDDDETNSSLRVPSLEDEETRTAVAKGVAASLVHALRVAGASEASDETYDSGIERAITKALTPDAIRALSESLRKFDSGVAMSGDIAIIPVGAVLQLLQVEGQSGVVTIRCGDDAPVSRAASHDASAPAREITISMRSGVIDLVQSRAVGDEFRLGRYLIGERIITEAELNALVDGEPGDKRLLGERLLHAGKIDDAQLHDALSRQSSELVYELLRWSRGHFEFQRCPVPPLAQHAKLSLPVASVVMEGFRRVDEWRVIEGRLGSFEAVVFKDETAIDALRKDDLARHERIVLEAVDGERTIREVVDASHQSSFDACRILVQLLEARIVRRKP